MLEQVIEIISDELNLDKEQIKKESRLREDLGVDSLDVVELVMRLEETFNVSVADDAAQKLETVGDIVDYLATLKA
ncbi:acyl carrier protein [Acholeplasma hippikon]|uniref:Acyl carrier protein n=1 Tax=Acholeplasma hippikon TaxID=264636 RepID=A0A449BI81_9MOLU|nr:acyl carrier protein [Acholeplasma hippikon]VEU82155.1 acyl carrier protein (ACP) [Acholeplasma hippikon]